MKNKYFLIIFLGALLFNNSIAYAYQFDDGNGGTAVASGVDINNYTEWKSITDTSGKVWPELKFRSRRPYNTLNQDTQKYEWEVDFEVDCPQDVSFKVGFGEPESTSPTVPAWYTGPLIATRTLHPCPSMGCIDNYQVYLASTRAVKIFVSRVAFGDRPAPEAAPVNSQPPDSTTPPSQPAAQNNASATPPPQQISQNQDSEKPLETTQQIESRYGDGYRAYKFGMTPTEVARAANMNVNTDWGTLPVASEYKNVEVRYFFQYLNRVEDVSKINGGRFSNTSYICYFFEDGKLFKASLRFMNSQEYPNHQSIFLLMAREMGATIQQYQNSSVFRTDTSKVKIHGKMDASATIVNFIKSGSPMTDAD